jgi:hypothetical protein
VPASLRTSPRRLTSAALLCALAALAAPRAVSAQCDPPPRANALAKALGELHAARKAPKRTAAPVHRAITPVARVAAPRAEHAAVPVTGAHRDRPAAKPARRHHSASNAVRRVAPRQTAYVCHVDTTLRMAMAPEMRAPLDQIVDSPFGLEPPSDVTGAPLEGASAAPRTVGALRPGIGAIGSGIGATPGISAGVVLGATVAALGAGTAIWRAAGHVTNGPDRHALRRSGPSVDLPTGAPGSSGLPGFGVPTTGSPDAPVGTTPGTGSGTPPTLPEGSTPPITGPTPPADAPPSGGTKTPGVTTLPSTGGTPGSGTPGSGTPGNDAAGGNPPENAPPSSPPNGGGGPTGPSVLPPTLPDAAGDSPVFPPRGDGPVPGDPLFPPWIPGLPHDSIPVGPSDGPHGGGDGGAAGETPDAGLDPGTPQSAVPEPATSLLLLAGLGAVAATITFARRR